MKLLRFIITVSLLTFCQAAVLAETSKEKEYSYYLDNDDKPDLIKVKIGSYSHTLYLSDSKTERYFYLDWNSYFFDSYQLLKEHPKDEVLISYQRENYQEIHHYKMLKNNYVQGNYIQGEPYIDTIDYIYPDKTLHKKFEDVRWDLRQEKFLIKDKNSDSVKPTYSKVEDHQLTNKQLFNIIEMGGGTPLVSLLLKTYSENENPYSALYLSKILKQYEMPNESEKYYLNFLRILFNKKIKMTDLEVTANLKPEKIIQILNKIPEKAKIIDIALGDINQDKIPEVAVFYFDKDAFVQVYEKKAETYKLKYSSQAMENHSRFESFDYHYENDPGINQSLLDIEDGMLSFKIRAKGNSFTDDRLIIVYFSLKNDALYLHYSLNLWQKNNDSHRRFFVVDYKKGRMFDYPTEQVFNLKNLEKLFAKPVWHKKAPLPSPIPLEKFVFTDPVSSTIFKQGYYPDNRKSFEDDFKQASQYYKEKRFYKILPLFYRATINDYLESYPFNDTNIGQYNDIAYYLQQANDHKNAILILKRVISYDSRRVVAYLNIADSYAAIGQYAQAKKYYFDYLQKMQLAGKQDKIPQRLIKLDHGILFILSKDAQIVSILKSAEGDLNGDKIKDYVFALKMKKGKQLSIFLSQGKTYKKVLENTTAIENIEENNPAENDDDLVQITIKDSRLSLTFGTEDNGEQVYQFKRLNKVFKLVLQKIFYNGRMNSSLITTDYLKKIKTIESSFVDFSNSDSGKSKQIETSKVEKLILDTNVTLDNFHVFRQKEINGN